MRAVLIGCLMLAGAAAIWRWSVIRDVDEPSLFIRIANFNARATVLFLGTLGVALVGAGLLSFV